MRKLSAFAVVFLAISLAALTPATADLQMFGAADEFRRTDRSVITPGLSHAVYERSGTSKAVANVAHIKRGADVVLRTVTSNDAIAGKGARLERTSSMCARVGCLVGVNGDFYREGIPVGASVAAGVLQRSPNKRHHQLLIGPKRALRAGGLDWKGKLVSTDLRSIRLDGFNVERGKDKLVLYTRAYGRSTQTNRYGTELVLRFDRPGRVPAIGETGVVRIARVERGGDTAIPKGGAVLSGHGADARALEDLWKRVRTGVAGRKALLRLETAKPTVEAIGGTPILVRNGKRWFADVATAFVRGRHPRTVVGWNERGDVWLVTVDGRQPGHSMGFTLAEAADFMISLGATEAINLDGGGSTTFAKGGEVVNRPSDRLVPSRRSIVAMSAKGGIAVERPVANALVVVPRAKAVNALAPPALGMDIPRVRTVTYPVPAEADPASNPAAAQPALIGALPPPPIGPARFWVALILLATAGGSLITNLSRRRALR